MNEILGGGDRDVYWDIVKGVAILLVLLGHSIQCCITEVSCFDNFLFRFIYSFHMPLFMIVSGYFYYYSQRKYKGKDLIRRKFMSIFIPIIAFGFLQFPIYFNGPWTFMNVIYHLLMSSTILWFLWQVILCTLTVFICHRIFKDSLFVYILIIFLSMFLPNKMGLERFSFMLPFFLFGYYLNNYKLKNSDSNVSFSKRKVFVISLMLFIILLFFYKRDSFIYTSKTFLFGELGPIKQLVINIYRILIGLVGSIVVLFLIRYFYDKSYFLRKYRIIDNIGSLSMGIYCLQTIFWHFYPYFNNRILSMSFIWSTLVGFFFSIIVCWSLSVLFSRVHLLNVVFLGGR